MKYYVIHVINTLLKLNHMYMESIRSKQKQLYITLDM